MQYPECPARRKMSILGADGAAKVIHQCAEPTCARAGTTITAYDCVNCPVRTLVGVRAKLRAAKPEPLPPDKVFSVAKTPLESEWPACRDRGSPVIVIECCGKVETVRKCKSKDAPGKGQPVTLEQCVGCMFRRE